MKSIPVLLILLFVTQFSIAQDIDAIINTKETERIEKVLSADDMQGRRSFTPAIDKAGDFIAEEFKKVGLQKWNGANYRQEFAMIRARLLSISANFDGHVIDPKNVIVITSQPELKINQNSGYGKVRIKAGDNFSREAAVYIRSNKNLLVIVDTSFRASFSRPGNIRRAIFKSESNVVFVLSVVDPSKFEIECKHEITEQKLANIAGILPGKSKKDEYIVFSGHYDHLGIGKPMNGDSIYNGANDDASGITAVILLAKYFTALANNERTLVFAAFTAEEVGGFGSQYFSRQYAPEKVIAMFNIEMIGTESKWGKNSAYITGYEKSDMGKILEKNLHGSAFAFYPDPYTSEQLFYRSDNATLARLGVPAHTISTSKMDNEPNYHTPGDEIRTLDMENMAMIIKAIALSAKTIINGKDSPSRVKIEELR